MLRMRSCACEVCCRQVFAPNESHLWTKRVAVGAILAKTLLRVA